MSEQSSNRSIAKNTGMLYIRMLLTMIVSLFTSRVILQTLGVTDFGIYNTVGGIVGFLSFINGALATGSSRFITFELGKGNFEKLKRTFSTTLTIHFILALLIILTAETFGLWFLYNKLIIPPERFESALWCFHLSMVAAAVTLTQVPYNAVIMAHEKMDIYAYISIVEVFAKLAIVYMLYIGSYDKLILYAVLYLILNVSLSLFYRGYCIRHFQETKYQFVIDWPILREIGRFSGWSLIASISVALKNQGVLIILNMFFEPFVVSARAISLQVNGVVNQFVNNFRAAVNPQIVKRYAVGEYESSKSLLLESAKYSYYLIFLLGMPIFFTADKLLQLWLDVVPDYTAVFLRLVIIQNLFAVFDTSFYTALYAKGDLKLNALMSPVLGILTFPIVYILFKIGYSPVALSWIHVGLYFTLAFVVKPYLLVRIVNYQFSDFFPLIKDCFMVSLFALVLPVAFYYFYYSKIDATILSFASMLSVVIFSVIISVWYIGLNAETRETVMCTIKNKLKNG